MRVIFDYVVPFCFSWSVSCLNTIMPPSHTLKDTTNHGGIYKCTQPTGKQKTIHSHGHVHVQICLTKHACTEVPETTFPCACSRCTSAHAYMLALQNCSAAKDKIALNVHAHVTIRPVFSTVSAPEISVLALS